MFFNPELSKYVEYFSFNNIKINDIVEIGIFILIAFYLIRHFQNSRVWVLIKGIITLFVIYALANAFALKTITSLFQSIITFFIIALIMMFQPELRKILESFGTKNISSNIFSYFVKKDTKRFSDQTIQELALSVDNMSKAKTGALILIENDIPLDEYIKTGILINSDISSQLITNIFEKNTPLHDGAMVIKGNKIVAATCYLPLSESKNINKALGTRHRAAIGASEQTDAFIIVVSEETGAISYVIDGKIKHNITTSKLVEKLQSINHTIKQTTPIIHKKNLTKNVIYSVLFGFIAWAVFAFAYNPVETIKINDIPVEVVNEDVIANLDKVYEITNGQTVNILVSGTRSELSNIDVDDFTASADFSKLSITNTATIEVTSKKDVVIDTKNAVMSIDIEDASEADLNVEIKKTGTEKTGFFVYNLSTDTPVIKISGPKSVIKKVDKAIAEIDVNGVQKDFETTSNILIYDKNGDVIDPSEYTASIKNINIQASVYNTKEIDVKLDVINTDDKNLEVLNTKLSSSKVLVAASESILDTLDEITIPVDITNSSSNVINSTIDLRNYLPSGVQCAGESNLEYTIEVGKYITKQITVNPTNIKVKNGSAQIKSNKFDITLILDEEKEVNINDLAPYIDVKDLTPGKYNLPLQFENLQNIRMEDVYNVDIVVK